uniref:Calumenin-A-like n=1 Tax=Saccoglossus kowalevskii TaxID=10224 RepID=A0ABM0GQZ1_SACKO|nr:PREDICTED: calumenin-A-like [Saccoglossus kowalevskii]
MEIPIQGRGKSSLLHQRLQNKVCKCRKQQHSCGPGCLCLNFVNTGNGEIELDDLHEIIADELLEVQQESNDERNFEFEKTEDIDEYDLSEDNVVEMFEADEVEKYPCWMMSHLSENRRDATGYELTDWIYSAIMATFWEETKRTLELVDADGDGMVSWNESLIFYFGESEDEDDRRYRYDYYSQEIEQDQLRFDLADDNNDGSLTVDEFFAFLHPELYNHMKDLITWKFFADFDKDKDGGVSLLEYIPPNPLPDEEEDIDNDGEPRWVGKAKARFAMIDSNKNGILEVPEALAVLMPDYHRAANSEARRIMKNVDENEDGKMSLKEVKKHYKVFTENEHVDFNSQIRRIRDEL